MTSTKFNFGEYSELRSVIFAFEKYKNEYLQVHFGHNVYASRNKNEVSFYHENKLCSTISFDEVLEYGHKIGQHALSAPMNKGVLDSEIIAEFAEKINIPKHSLKAPAGQGSDLTVVFPDGDMKNIQVKSNRKATLSALGKDGCIEYKIKNIDLVNFTLDKNGDKTISRQEMRRLLKERIVNLSKFRFVNFEFIKFMNNKIPKFAKAQKMLTDLRFEDSSKTYLSNLTRRQRTIVIPYIKGMSFGFSKRNYMEYSPDPNTILWNATENETNDDLTFVEYTQNMPKRIFKNMTKNLFISGQSRVKDLRILKDEDESYWLRVSAKLRTMK